MFGAPCLPPQTPVKTGPQQLGAAPAVSLPARLLTTTWSRWIRNSGRKELALHGRGKSALLAGLAQPCCDSGPCFSSGSRARAGLQAGSARLGCLLPRRRSTLLRPPLPAASAALLCHMLCSATCLHSQRFMHSRAVGRARWRRGLLLLGGAALRCRRSRAAAAHPSVVAAVAAVAALAAGPAGAAGSRREHAGRHHAWRHHACRAQHTPGRASSSKAAGQGGLGRGEHAASRFAHQQKPWQQRSPGGPIMGRAPGGNIIMGAPAGIPGNTCAARVQGGAARGLAQRAAARLQATLHQAATLACLWAVQARSCKRPAAGSDYCCHQPTPRPPAQLCRPNRPPHTPTCLHRHRHALLPGAHGAHHEHGLPARPHHLQARAAGAAQRRVSWRRCSGRGRNGFTRASHPGACSRRHGDAVQGSGQSGA